VAIQEVIQATLDLCYESIQSKEIELVVVFDEPKLITHGRPTELSQALLHLINNAVDEVANISSPKIWIVASRGRKGVKISVMDNGRGISTEMKDKIFQPFFTSKFSDKHTGLGLNVAHGIAKSHGGSLLLEADKQGRTKFSLEV